MLVQSRDDDCRTAEDVRRRAKNVAQRRAQSFGCQRVIYIKSEPKTIVKYPSDQELFGMVAQQNGLSITELSDAIRLIKTQDVKPAIQVTVIEIQKAVAQHGEIPIRELIGCRRNRELVKPRQIGMALSKALTRRPLAEIGRRFRRDHTTVMHAVHKLEKLVAHVEDSLRPGASLDEWVVQMFRHHDTFVH